MPTEPSPRGIPSGGAKRRSKEPWQDVWKDAIAAASGRLESQGVDARDYLKDAAAAHKAALESLLAAFTDGKIDRDTLDAELADEKRVLRTELLAVKVMTKKAAQDAANAFFDAIESALAAGIKGLL